MDAPHRDGCQREFDARYAWQLLNHRCSPKWPRTRDEFLQDWKIYGRERALSNLVSAGTRRWIERAITNARSGAFGVVVID